MTRQCANSSCPNKTDRGLCQSCRVEQNWGDSRDYDGDGQRADLRDTESTDENSHASATLETLRNADDADLETAGIETDEDEDGGEDVRCDGGRQPTVEFRELECVSCNVIDEHRIEEFHDDGYARIQCGVCQFDRKESLDSLEDDQKLATDGGTSAIGSEQIDYDHEVVVDSVDEVTPVPIECPGCGGQFREALTEKIAGTTCDECNDWIRYVRRHETRDRGDETEDTTEQTTLMTDGGFEHTTHTASFSCDDCDDFELEKSYSGIAGTPGEEEYDRIQAPETCPACGGPVTRDDVATDGGTPDSEWSFDAGTVTHESIAADIMEYLRENPGVCAEGNTVGWRWVRHTDGEWRATDYGGQHRLSGYVNGTTLEPETVRGWLTEKPVTLLPASEAYQWGPSETTVWENAADQDVFTDADRCFYCGVSEHTTDLERYETTEQGECLFCADCHDTWERAGEIVGRAVRADGGTSATETQQARLDVGDTRKPVAVKNARRVTTGDLAALAMCAHRFDPADVRGWYTHDYEDVRRQWICSNVESVIARLSPHCEDKDGDLPPLHPSDDLWVGTDSDSDTTEQARLVTDGGRQSTVEFREMECVSCDAIDEHRIEKFHDDGYARIQCGVCQFDRKEPLDALEDDEPPSTTDRIVSQIRAFSESTNDPDSWRILIPTESFDSVTERLDTESDLGTYYNEITLCYTDHHDEPRVEYKSDLSDHLQASDHMEDHQ